MNCSPVKFNNNISHPIIPPEQQYTIERKLVTIHSEDRDVCKWPNSNHFEIQLPETIQNIQSVRLSEITLPSHFYNISRQFQNNALVYSNNATGDLQHVELPDGFYSPPQLANVLNQLLDGVSVFYDHVIQRFVFYSTQSEFSLNFDHQICYKKTCDTNKSAWCQSTKWGLGYLLGFDKTSYTSETSSSSTSCIPEGVKHFIENDVKIDDDADYSKITNTQNVIVSPKFPKLEGELAIYMEVDKYNSYDELIPYPSKTNNMYLNSYGGNVNAAFAKIQITKKPSASGSTPYVSNRTHKLLETIYDPPVEKLQKLKFKFRYHNGMLVDFQDTPFSFSIEINSLRNDMKKNYKIGCNQTFC